MERFNVWRVITATAIAFPSCAAIAAVMFYLPKSLALWGAMSGIVLFKVGHGTRHKWCVIGGGVLMFGSVFAWAIRQ